MGWGYNHEIILEKLSCVKLIVYNSYQFINALSIKVYSRAAAIDFLNCSVLASGSPALS